MLKKSRKLLAFLTFTAVTLLFLDFTGSVHGVLGWLAKIQFLPALFALNAGVIIALLLLTIIFGRLYCSVICPLGIFQDVFFKFGSMHKKNRFRYSPAKSILRYVVLAVFILAFATGIGSLVALLDPYGAYGRIASQLFAPIYQLGNNALAYLAERADSYAFYSVDVWMKGIGIFAVAAITFILLAVLAYRNGRTYCNTICPVGTVLGFISRFSLFKITIDTQKCNGCGLCGRNCKASCIDTKQHKIDYSRCVVCFDCLDKCRQGALSYAPRWKKTDSSVGQQAEETVDNTRRSMLTIGGTLLATSALKAQEAKLDGGLAFIEDKKIPNRKTPLVPAGALSIKHFADHCTGCQLCVSACPNQVLRPSTGLMNFMQPEMSYERGYCRPECTKCSEVCPAGAIRPITREEKSSVQIGHAVWIKKNCIPLTDGVECGNCARHCPNGAIRMVPSKPGDESSVKIPVINTERCIGCGACENLCPARPFSAIYVEGHQVHKTN